MSGRCGGGAGGLEQLDFAQEDAVEVEEGGDAFFLLRWGLLTGLSGRCGLGLARAVEGGRRLGGGDLSSTGCH